MAVRVTHFCSYLTNVNSPWRPEDFDAYKFVHALKGHQLRGYAKIPVRGSTKRLNGTNIDSAIGWFADMATDFLTGQRALKKFMLVPIPNSSSTVRGGAKPRTVKLADALAARIGERAKVLDCLRWKKNLGSASAEGGPRDAKTLYENLQVTEKFVEGTEIVLVDDVMTSGGHFQAATARLRGHGAVVRFAVCGGRTTKLQEKRAFSVEEEPLEDFAP